MTSAIAVVLLAIHVAGCLSDFGACDVQGAPPLGLKLDTAAVLAQMSNTRLIQA